MDSGSNRSPRATTIALIAASPCPASNLLRKGGRMPRPATSTMVIVAIGISQAQTSNPFVVSDRQSACVRAAMWRVVESFSHSIPQPLRRRSGTSSTSSVKPGFTSGNRAQIAPLQIEPKIELSAIRLRNSTSRVWSLAMNCQSQQRQPTTEIRENPKRPDGPALRSKVARQAAGLVRAAKIRRAGLGWPISALFHLRSIMVMSALASEIDCSDDDIIGQIGDASRRQSPIKEPHATACQRPTTARLIAGTARLVPKRAKNHRGCTAVSLISERAQEEG